MRLQDLLEELRENILNDRTDRREGTSDYLWSDKTLVRYINEAQRRFAVRSLIIRDGTTPEVTQFRLVTGQTTYELHESVLAVISGRSDTQQADLTRVGHSMLSGYQQSFESFSDPAVWKGLPDGPALGFSTDETLSPDDYDSFGRVTLRIYPTPRLADNNALMRLRVIRKPIEQLKITNLSASPEIPEDHHIEMLDWAAYLALRIVDDDAGAPKRASEFAASFEAHVKEARNIAMRKLFAPTQPGFGRGGWTWSS